MSAESSNVELMINETQLTEGLTKIGAFLDPKFQPEMPKDISNADSQALKDTFEKDKVILAAIQEIYNKTKDAKTPGSIPVTKEEKDKIEKLVRDSVELDPNIKDRFSKFQLNSFKDLADVVELISGRDMYQPPKVTKDLTVPSADQIVKRDIIMNSLNNSFAKDEKEKGEKAKQLTDIKYEKDGFEFRFANNDQAQEFAEKHKLKFEGDVVRLTDEQAFTALVSRGFADKPDTTIAPGRDIDAVTLLSAIKGSDIKVPKKEDADEPPPPPPDDEDEEVDAEKPKSDEYEAPPPPPPLESEDKPAPGAAPAITVPLAGKTQAEKDKEAAEEDQKKKDALTAQLTPGGPAKKGAPAAPALTGAEEEDKSKAKELKTEEEKKYAEPIILGLKGSFAEMLRQWLDKAIETFTDPDSLINQAMGKTLRAVANSRPGRLIAGTLSGVAGTALAIGGRVIQGAGWIVNAATGGLLEGAIGKGSFMENYENGWKGKGRLANIGKDVYETGKNALEYSGEAFKAVRYGPPPLIKTEPSTGEPKQEPTPGKPTPSPDADQGNPDVAEPASLDADAAAEPPGVEMDTAAADADAALDAAGADDITVEADAPSPTITNHFDLTRRRTEADLRTALDQQPKPGEAMVKPANGEIVPSFSDDMQKKLIKLREMEDKAGAKWKLQFLPEPRGPYGASISIQDPAGKPDDKPIAKIRVTTTGLVLEDVEKGKETVAFEALKEVAKTIPGMEKPWVIYNGDKDQSSKLKSAFGKDVVVTNIGEKEKAAPTPTRHHRAKSV